ncbi:MAG: hypothetical protein QHH43_10015 [Candidatus Saccharicenans sp.]|nr:hypothetical protein [Candidatus Saccharicenans sp.]MDH7576079.1 hypothetical protein [Candidatus Saccharicenans sp.]
MEEIQEYGENALLDDYPRKELVFFNEHWRFYVEITQFVGLKILIPPQQLNKLFFFIKIRLG